MAREILVHLKAEYLYIRFSIVLAYLPKKAEQRLDNDIETVFPEGLEVVPCRFAIHRRNRWMVQEADVVITYVKNSAGGAAQFQTLALQKKKRVINLAEKR